MKKKTAPAVSFLLAVCLLFCAVPFAPRAAAATAIGSGECGDAAFWTLDENGVLSITGSGPMRDFKHRYDYVSYDSMSYTYTYRESRLTVAPDYSFRGRQIAPNYVEQEQTGEYVALMEDGEDCMTMVKCFCDVPWYALRDRIRTVKIAEGITYIGDYAFFYSGAETVALPASVGGVGKYVFTGCGALREAAISGAVTYLGDFMFDGCERLRAVSLPDTLTGVGTACFRNCARLTALALPAGVRAIYSHAFENCGMLAALTLPAGLITVGNGVFANCLSLTELALPAGLRTLGNGAFSGCGSLKRIVFPDGFREIPEACLQGCASLTAVGLPEGVVSIGEYAFQDCAALTDLMLPASLKTVSKGAFSGCAGLKLLEIPAGTEELGAQSFALCSSLAVLYLPVSLTKIGESAFSGCKHQKAVFYGGTLEDWLAVELGGDNDALSSAFVFRFEETPEHAHSLQAVPARESTCAQVGVIACYRCALCGRYYLDADAQTRASVAGITMPVPPHALVFDEGTPETCTTPGISDGAHCAVCGYVPVAQREIGATGHRWDDGVITQTSTCTEKGKRVHTCANCGETKTLELPLLDHKTVWKPKKAPTCTQPGNEEYWLCTVCGQTFSDSRGKRSADPVIPASGHQYSAWKAAADGVETRTCAKCRFAETMRPGDADGDGGVSAADARLALRRAVELETFEAGSRVFRACDATGDGTVTAEDARLILRAAVGLEDPAAWIAAA